MRVGADEHTDVVVISAVGNVGHRSHLRPHRRSVGGASRRLQKYLNYQTIFRKLSHSTGYDIATVFEFGSFLVFFLET